jgi:hypothetical protein
MALTETEKKQKLQGILMGQLENVRMRAAALQLVRPLIERSAVAPKLKERAFASAPRGLSLTKLQKEHGPGVAAVLADLAANRMVRLNSVGDYEPASPDPSLTLKEARAYVRLILEDWPARDAVKIIETFKDDEEDDKSED